MNEDHLTDLIMNFLDSMRVEFHCVAHVRKFKQSTISRMLAQDIIEDRPIVKWPIED